MVLTLKRWKSRSSPGIEAGGHIKTHSLVRDPTCKRRRPSFNKGPTPPFARPTHGRAAGDAGWSSPVARQAHNLKVVGSNPTPATNVTKHPLSEGPGALLVWANSISVKLHTAWPHPRSTAPQPRAPAQRDWQQTADIAALRVSGTSPATDVGPLDRSQPGGRGSGSAAGDLALTSTRATQRGPIRRSAP
jgi:hypothetical protein